MADSLHQDTQIETEAQQFLAKMQRLQEVNLELSRTATLEDLYRQAIVLGRSRLGFDRLGLLLYDEASNMMYGTFGTDDEGNLRDERAFAQPVEDQRLLHVLHSPDRMGYWVETRLHDMGQAVGEGWNAMAVLWSGEKGVGWLATDNLLTGAPLDERQLDILTLYGATLGHLVTTKRLEQELKDLAERRTRQIRLTTQVSQAIAGATNLDDLYERVVTEVKEQFGYYHTQLLRYDPQTDTVRLIAGYGPIGQQMKAAGHAMPLGVGLIGTAVATGQTILRTNLTQDPDWQPNPLLPETQGEIAVPIKLGETILGVLDVQSDTNGALNADDQLLLEGLCGQIAIAIESTRLTSELQETTYFLDSVIDNVPTMLFVKEAENLRFVRQNKAGLEMLGVTADEILGKNDYDLFPPSEAEFFIGKDREVLASGQMLDIPEETLPTPAGVRYLHTRKTALVDTHGRPKYLLGIAEDITERKQTLDALRQERALLSSLLNSIPDLIFYKDVAGVYLGCNTAFAEFAGRSVADIVGKTDFDMFPHEVAAFFREQDLEMMAQGEPRHNDEWVDYQDGRRVLLDTLKTPFYDTDHNLLGLIGISRDMTATYRSQEELRRLGYVVEQSLDGTAVANMNGIVEFANPAWAAMHGYTVAELIGQHLSIFHTPEQLAQEVIPLNDMVLSTGQGQQTEVGHARKDGSVFPTLMTINVLRDDANNPVGLVAAAQDITERKAAEQSLRESQARLLQATQVVENSPVVLFRWRADEHWTVEYVSENVSRFGYTPDELLSGRVPYASLVHPDDLARVAQEVGDFSASGVTQFTQEYRIITRDGAVRWTDDRTVIIRDDAGQITHYQGIVIDITERKEAERELQLRNSALEAAADCIVITNPKGTILYVNSAFTRLTQYTREEAVGNTLRLIKSGVHDEAFYQQMWGVLLSGQSWHGEITNRRKDGVLYPEDMTITPVTKETGEITYFVAIKRDITDRKTGEQAQREGQARLEEATRIARLHYWEFDVATQRFTFLPAYYELLGTTVEEEGGYTMSAENYARNFVPDYEAPIVGSEIAAALTSDDPNYSREFDSLNLTKDGRIFPIRVRYRVVKDQAGNTVKFVGANQDITEQVKAEQELREAQARAETILRAVTVPMLISNVQGGQIVYANEHLATTVRVPLDRLVGHVTPNFYVRDEDRTAVIGQIQAQGNVQNYQLQLRRDDGELFWALLSARLIDFQGTPSIITSLIDITDRINAEARLVQQARDLQTVADLSTAVRANLQDPQELLQQVVNLTKERFNLYHAHIYLLDPAGKALILTAGAGDVGRSMVAEGRRIPLAQEQSLVARAARTRLGVIINDVQADPGFLFNPLLPDTRAEMAVPMLVGDQVLGVLDVQADQPHLFTDADVNIHTTLAAQIAIAVENSRLLNQSQQAVDELDMLTRRLTRESWTSYLQSFDEQTTGYAYDYGQLLPLDKGDALSLTAVTRETDHSGNGNGRLTRPLTVHGEPIGHLALFAEEDEVGAEQSPLDAAEVEAIIAAVAEQLSARIENIRLTDQTQAALLLTENLYEAGRRLNTSGENLQEAVAAVAEAAPIPAVTRLILFLTEHDAAGTPVAIRHAANWYSGRGNPPPPAGSRYTREMLQNLDSFNTHEIVVVGDTAVDERLGPLMRFMFQQMGTPSLAILPLWVGDRQLGSLFLETTEPYTFREADLEPYVALSAQLAIAIDRQRLLFATEQRAERERQIRTITDKIRRGTDRESILRVAREEIGQMLGAKTAVAQLGAPAQVLQRLQPQGAAEEESAAADG